MSIQKLPSGAFRAQVWDRTTNRNISVGIVLGTLSTFATREQAEAAREAARVILNGSDDATRRAQLEREARRAAAERRREERANELKGADLRRQRIRDRVAHWVATDYAVDPESGCWNWLLRKDEHGYGRVNRRGRNGLSEQAHRWYFERLVGPIPDYAHLDHLCRNPSCVNPEHLDPVTPRENVIRGIKDSQ